MVITESQLHKDEGEFRLRMARRSEQLGADLSPQLTRVRSD